MKYLFTIIFSALLFSTVTYSQEAVAKVEAISPVELEELGLDSTYIPSNGLNVVGNEEKIYLLVTEADGESITNVNWQVVSSPGGSTASVDSQVVFTTFATDQIGEYLISATITTASGIDTDTVRVVAANYVGVGGVGGIPPVVNDGQCMPCHFPIEEKWKNTGHGTFFQLAIDGMKSDHYSANCIECHTVGYNEFADNGGFDDVADASGWTFPAILEDGNWEDIVNNYPEVAKKSNIQCENCHGPGSIHLGNAANIDFTIDEGMCGRCHEDEPYHIQNVQWKNSRHSVGVEFASTRESCNPCHSGWGFIQFATDHQYIDINTGVAQVTCAVCHDPHSSENPHQIRIMSDVELENNYTVSDGGKGKLCMNCHKSREDAQSYATQYSNRFGPHHGPQTDMLVGQNVITYGKTLPSTGHDFIAEDACVTCHMSPTPPDGPARNQIGGHSFNMNYEGTDNVSACVNCHGPIESFDDITARADYDGDGNVESVHNEVLGLLDVVGKLLPPFGDPEVVVDTTQFPIETYTPKILKASYNHLMVTEDKSEGMHNAAFTIELLRATFADLTGTSVGEEYQPNTKPVVYELEQNYPNPFNPSTKIKFSIPKNSEVILIIYDALGREVEELVNGNRSAGTYEVTWNAENYSSGIYFYRIKTDNFVQTKKMLLVK